MPKSIVNLTGLVVAEIEQIVGDHYYHPYQDIFTNSHLRQELMAYILARVRNVHITVEAGEESRLQPETIPYLTEIKLQIEDFIHQGIHYILQKYGSLVSHGIEGNYGDLTPPHWFC